jgi:glycosyltransferase involved in cell wall biosynthesis
MVYESLEAQSYRDFEWLIIDDGSGPAVGEAVAILQREATFPIRYYWQENGGKHAAHNHAVSKARGRYFAMLDDDDTVLPNALERMLYHWEQLPMGEEERYAAVIGLCTDQHGKLFGEKFPVERSRERDPKANYLDSNFIELTYQLKCNGERWGSYRTEILKQFSYPILPGRSAYMIEEVTWLRFGRVYRTRYVNEVWRIWYVGHYSITSDRARQRIDYVRIAPTQSLIHRQKFVEMIDMFRWRRRGTWFSAAHYVRFSLHARYSLRRQWRETENWRSRLLWISAFPFGLAAWLRDQPVIWKRKRVVARESAKLHEGDLLRERPTALSGESPAND